jgi:hypothetical protein
MALNDANTPHTVMVGAHSESLFTAHNDSVLAGRLVFKESNISEATLLPFFGITVVHESEQLGTTTSGSNSNSSGESIIGRYHEWYA